MSGEIDSWQTDTIWRPPNPADTSTADPHSTVSRRMRAADSAEVGSTVSGGVTILSRSAEEEQSARESFFGRDAVDAHDTAVIAATESRKVAARFQRDVQAKEKRHTYEERSRAILRAAAAGAVVAASAKPKRMSKFAKSVARLSSDAGDHSIIQRASTSGEILKEDIVAGGDDTGEFGKSHDEIDDSTLLDRMTLTSEGPPGAYPPDAADKAESSGEAAILTSMLAQQREAAVVSKLQMGDARDLDKVKSWAEMNEMATSSDSESESGDHHYAKAHATDSHKHSGDYFGGGSRKKFGDARKQRGRRGDGSTLRRGGRDHRDDGGGFGTPKRKKKKKSKRGGPRTRSRSPTVHKSGRGPESGSGKKGRKKKRGGRRRYDDEDYDSFDDGHAHGSGKSRSHGVGGGGMVYRRKSDGKQQSSATESRGGRSDDRRREEERGASHGSRRKKESSEERKGVYSRKLYSDEFDYDDDGVRHEHRRRDDSHEADRSRGSSGGRFRGRGSGGGKDPYDDGFEYERDAGGSHSTKRSPKPKKKAPKIAERRMYEKHTIPPRFKAGFETNAGVRVDLSPETDESKSRFPRKKEYSRGRGRGRRRGRGRGGGGGMYQRKGRDSESSYSYTASRRG